jgi:hypothetical protein
MKQTVSGISLVLAAATVLAAVVAISLGRPDYCGPACGVPTFHGSVSLDAPSPTLAPPQKVVVLRVEIDKPDLEVGWVENN